MNLEKAFNSLIDSSESTYEECYVKNGLAFCVHCNTPKQTKITNPFTGKDIIVWCVCDCEKQRMEEEEEKRHKETLEKHKLLQRRNSFTDSSLSDCTFADDDDPSRKHSIAIRNYCDKFDKYKEDGYGLLLLGELGTGKTFYSACLANELISNGYRVYMTNVPSVISRIQRNTFDEDIIEELAGYDLLILDDLGTESTSDFRKEKLFDIVDARYRAKKPMVISTNLSFEEVSNCNDVSLRRVYERIIDRCYPVKFDGKSRRSPRNVMDEMKDLYG